MWWKDEKWHFSTFDFLIQFYLWQSEVELSASIRSYAVQWATAILQHCRNKQTSQQTLVFFISLSIVFYIIIHSSVIHMRYPLRVAVSWSQSQLLGRSPVYRKSNTETHSHHTHSHICGIQSNQVISSSCLREETGHPEETHTGEPPHHHAAFSPSSTSRNYSILFLLSSHLALFSFCSVVVAVYKHQR